MTFNIAIVLYPGFEELDVAGPYEAFGTAKRMLAPDWRVFTIATGSPIQGTHGLSVNPDYLVEDAPDPQMLVIPGGQTVAAIADDRLLSYVQTVGAKTEWLTSVCTGAFMLWRAGFLKGRRATTYWAAIDRLKELGGVTVVDDERWVHDGNVITAAGITAGIDMALYIVGQLLSPKAARTVQQYMEYYPAPPYAEEPLA